RHRRDTRQGPRGARVLRPNRGHLRRDHPEESPSLGAPGLMAMPVVVGRAVCHACRRPEIVCYCSHVTPLTTRTRVVILQHLREGVFPVNAARLASLCLPGAELHVGREWGGERAEQALPDPARPAALLFPGPGAIDVEEQPPTGPITLVVVDGTWWQARKL